MWQIFSIFLLIIFTDSSAFSQETAVDTTKRRKMDLRVFQDPTALNFSPLDLNNAHFRSRESWEKFGAALRESRKDESAGALADWGTLQDLNVESGNIWNDLVDCAGGAEQARSNYFSGALCSSPDRAAILKTRIIKIHQDFDTFLRTTLFFIPKAGKRSPGKRNRFDQIIQALYDDLYSKKRLDYDGNDPKVREWLKMQEMEQPLFHPFFTQILIEYMTVLNRISYSPAGSRYNVRHSRESEGPLIDYPFSALTTAIRTSELAYWSELSAAGLLDTPQSYETARVFANSWNLFAMVTKENCGQFGLWTEMSFAAIIVITGQIGNDFSRELARMVNEPKCTKGAAPGHHFEEWANAPANVNDVDLILAQRKMGVQYGLKEYKEVKCRNSFRDFWEKTPKYLICKTVDPLAPTDVKDYFDWALEDFSNPKAVRARNATLFIGNQ